jgi:NADH-quinone oxidoreductase subunit L
LVGTSVLFFSANSWTQENLGVSGFSIRGLSAWALTGDPSHAAITVGAVALFIACIGKSGQFPLHTWLPDAMAGPTPVSSLLHSSTMVVAGVFLVARLYPVFFEGMNILGSGVNLITVIGGITIVVAAALAFVQTDIKKVLAYSTVSQLGYMMMGLGAGAWLPAVFHIFTHAFFKACLFLAAGSISHSASHHSFEMKKDMGGLRKFMPITFTTWIISTLALCGVFPFAGFFSKDEIIDNVGHNGYTVFMVVGLVGAFMTAAYMTRATYLTFFGEPRGASAGESHDDHGDAHAAHDTHDAHDSHDAHASHGPHESNLFITVPLMILATLALSAGLFNATPFGKSWERMAKWVEPRSVVVEDIAHASVGETHFAPSALAAGDSAHKDSVCGTSTPEKGICYAPKLDHAPFKWAKGAMSVFIVLMGMLISWLISVQMYTKKAGFFVGLTGRNKLLALGYRFLVNKYYLDHLYEKVIVHGIAHPIAKAAYWVNQNILDGIVNGAGLVTRRVAGWVYRNVDQRVVDGAVNGSGAVARGTGNALRPVQSGKVSQYGALLFAAAAVAGLVLIIVNT